MSGLKSWFVSVGVILVALGLLGMIMLFMDDYLMRLLCGLPPVLLISAIILYYAYKKGGLS